MGLAEEFADLLIRNLDGILLLILSALLSLLVSWLTARHSWKVQKTDEMKRLWKQSLADLIAEMEQNKQNGILDKWIPLDTAAYDRFKQEGFLTTKLEEGLRKQLVTHYSHVLRKNNLVEYYNSFMPSLPPEQRNANSGTLLGIIDQAKKQVDDEIPQILPKLNALITNL
jgi:hypothetical protein